jgi:Holliday junction DNA helicase RuvA
MYAFIEGEIVNKLENRIVVRADGMGLAFNINVPARTIAELPAPGGNVRLYTSFQVREDSQSLFGFETPAERDLFEALLKISGIGGKIALAILDLPRDRIVAAIAAGDAAVLQRVQGVGPKTAGRIVLELKDRFAQELLREWAESTATGREAGLPPLVLGIEATGLAEAIEALVELGYQRVEARERVRRARAALGEDSLAEDIVRHALQH